MANTEHNSAVQRINDRTMALIDDPAAADVDRALAREHGLLSLFDDLAHHYYLSPSAEIFYSDALAPQDGLQRVTDPKQCLAILRVAVEDDPALVGLIPARPLTLCDCRVCDGTGRRPQVAVGDRAVTVVCFSCRGTGWTSCEPDNAG